MCSNDQLWNRAKSVLPGGVNSPVRSFRAVGGTPVFIRRAAGCRLHDELGRAYIDYVGSWGPMIAGHAHPLVVDAMSRQLRDGTSYGAPHRLEVELAEEICSRIPAVEMVRMTSSGTEAAMSAIRLARAITGRDRIIKFAGCYHGHADALLVSAGSGVATHGAPDSPGVPAAAVKDTIVAPYNDLTAVESIMAGSGDSIAAVLVEPVAGNMGVVPPAAGFLDGLRSVTERYGALLVFDEVMTGFRLSRGGAQQAYGVPPDLTIMGKVVGGGMPVGALGGPARYMDWIAPLGPVYQAGTLSGNPLAMAAGLATLRLLDDVAYKKLEATAAQLHTGLETAIADGKILAAVQRVGSMISVFFRSKGVYGFDDARAADHDAYSRFFHAMLDGGVHLPPSGYESWFVSLAHEPDDIQRTVTSATDALRSIRAD